MQSEFDYTSDPLHERRERVFLILAGLFLGTMTMLNILGISHFVNLSGPFQALGYDATVWVAVGVLPYPVTFLCTDLISEFYGRKRASNVVWMGVLLNFWIVFVFWLGASLPPGRPPADAEPNQQAFFLIRDLAMAAVAASIIAFVIAQFIDVYLYHFWKRLTKGRALWLRNNGSTMVSQLVDTTAVILITHYYAKGLPVDQDQPIAPQLVRFIRDGYLYKLAFALFDTALIYPLVYFLKGYLQIDPRAKGRGPDQDGLERVSTVDSPVLDSEAHSTSAR